MPNRGFASEWRDRWSCMMRPAKVLERFVGEIAGTGTASGVRLVIGAWSTSPLGTFADAMVEDADGRRVLVAPSNAVAAYVSSVYSFDEVVVTPVGIVRTPAGLALRCSLLSVELAIGERDLLGRLLHSLPRALSTSPRWASAVDPICRVVLRDVRTRARTSGADEFYGASDRHHLTRVSAMWRGSDLGPMADVEPPVRFGGSSAPRKPSIVAITTTVRRLP